MTLYISNPSRQQTVFYYRRAVTRDNSGPHSIPIPSGCQVAIGQRWTKEETAYVIEQILRAGGADAAEAHGKMGAFTGLLYREGHAVDEDEIVTAHESVLKDAQDRSVKQATLGALGFDRVANTTNKGRRGQRLARVTEVEVIQELPPHQHPTGDEVHFQMTIDPEGSSDMRGLPV